MFHVGQLVVCVDDRDHPEWHRGRVGMVDSGGLRRGTVYTIRRSVEVCPVWGNPTILLCEIVREAGSKGFEIGFHARRFRPIDDTRLAIFRQHLRPVEETA